MRVPRTSTRRRDSAMKRLFVIVSITVIAVLGWGSAPVGAATPAIQGCYGDSISSLATNQPDTGAFGAGVVGFAQDPNSRPGIGDGVQLLQAGQVPDGVVPNTCNVP